MITKTLGKRVSGQSLVETVAVLVIEVCLLMACLAIVAEVGKISSKVRFPAMDALEVRLMRICAGVRPSDISIDPDGRGVPDSIRMTCLSKYRDGVWVTYDISLKDGSVQILENGQRTFAAENVSALSFIQEDGVLVVHAEGKGWTWDRAFELLTDEVS